MDVIDYTAEPPHSGVPTAPEIAGVTRLGTTDRYTVERVRVEGTKTYPQPHDFICLSVIDGSGSVNRHAVHKGTHFIAPYQCGDLEFARTYDAYLLVGVSSDVDQIIYSTVRTAS